MNKKLQWVVGIGCLACLSLVIVFFLQRHNTTLRQSTSESTQLSEKKENERLPTLAELEKKYGNQVIDQGKYTLTTAFFKENPHVELMNDKQETLNLPISAIKEDGTTVTFQVDSLETTKPTKKVGQTIQLVSLKNEKTYIEYQE